MEKVCSVLSYNFCSTHTHTYRVSQELRSLFQELIPELIPSQKRHIHMDPIGNGSKVMSF